LADVLATIYPEIGAGGFTRLDGSVQFYGRIAALLRPEMTVVDLGAGRGCQFEDDVAYRRGLAKIQGRVGRVIGLDVDPAVLTNEHVDEALHFDGTTFPLQSDSVDLIYSDWVLEHIEHPERFASEIDRVLKPGGWFCARTPASLSLIAIASRLVPNRLHAASLEYIQDGTRKSEDVFPAYYRLNSLRALRRHFPASRWENYSYTWSPSPSYHFGKSAIARAVAVVQYVKLPFGGENLFVFVRKRAG
jgi:SAM-dependent methyltransferase